jgi:hypothetical protein
MADGTRYSALSHVQVQHRRSNPTEFDAGLAKGLMRARFNVHPLVISGYRNQNPIVHSLTHIDGEDVTVVVIVMHARARKKTRLEPPRPRF